MADTEQHFILRVQDAELAARLRGWLRGSERDSDKLEELRLLFDDADDRKGVLIVDGVQHEVFLQDLPTVVESYKTLDDANLVKITDIGQVLLVVDPAMKSALSYNKYSAPDGVTPPMRKARGRHFRPAINLPKAHMQEAVKDVMEMLAGRAPAGYQFQDFEEEYVIDAAGKGSWQQVKAAKQPRAAAAAAAAAAGAAAAGDGSGGGKARGGRGGAAVRRKAAAEDSGGEEDFEMTESD